MSEYIDQGCKIWNFLCEVENKAELWNVCRKNGVQCTTSKSRPCLEKRLFQRTNGERGYNCPYRLIFRPHSNSSNDSNAIGHSSSSAYGAVFCSGEHAHSRANESEETRSSRFVYSKAKGTFLIIITFEVMRKYSLSK